MLSLPNTGKLFIEVHGCQMNIYDSKMIVNTLKNFGYSEVNTIEEADMVILVTCHIREKAAEKVYSRLGVLRALEKKEKRKIITIVAGCVAQAEGEEIQRRAQNVDIVVGPQSLHLLPELIVKYKREKGYAIKLDFTPIEKFDALPINNNVASNFSEFLTIQEGCDKFCTFCVVPYTRGPEYSRPVSAIYREALSLVEKGAKELVLLGQNVNAYKGKHNEEYWNLAKLITELAKIRKLERIRYTTSHPTDMNHDLSYVHSLESKLMPFIHLPVQTGSDKLLKRMNRKHTKAEYLKVISDLRSHNQNIQFSSDFIVGFPGEQEADFQETLDLVEKVQYAQAYSFKYSPRPGTPGAEYIDQVPEEIKSERLERLQALLKKQQLKFNQNTVGKTLPVLFDRIINNQVSGRTPLMQLVYMDDLSLYGKIVNVLITEGHQNTLQGKIVSFEKDMLIA